MSDPSDGTFTPEPTEEMLRKRKHSPSPIQSKDHGWSRQRHISRDRQRTRKYRRNRSRTPVPRKQTRRMGRSRFRSEKKRHRERRHKSKTSTSSMRSSSSRSTSLSSATSTSSTSSTSTRSSRSRKRQACSKRRRRDAHRSNRNQTDHSVMERFIEAISSHGQNTFVGAQDVIHSFDPSQRNQSTKAWLKKVNETASIYKWNDKQTILHALPKLSGLARQWYEGLSSVKYTWKEWQRKMLASFPDDRNYADKLSEMLLRRSRREETLEEYFYEKAKLVSHCNIRGKEAVDCIIHGIYDNNIKLNAQGARFKSPSKLLKYLRSISTKIPNRDGRKTVPIVKSNVPISKNSNYPKNKQPNAAPIICYNCSEPGHTAPKCRKETQKCSKCSRLGHLPQYCKRNTNDTIKPMSSTGSVGDTTNRIQRIITENEVENNIYNKMIRINDTTHLAFVDFGSQCTIIKKSVVDKLGLSIDHKEIPLLKGFAFGTLTPLGKVTIDLKIDFVETTIEAYVVHDEYLNTDLLIGQDVTELPKVSAYKTKSSLVLYSDDSMLDKVKVYVAEDVTVHNIQIVKIVLCDESYSGHIYIPGNASLKDGEGIATLPGSYSVENGMGHIPVLSFEQGEVTLKKNRLLTRARLLPAITEAKPSNPPTEFQVKTITLPDSKAIHIHNEPITIDMLNVGSDLTQEQTSQLLELVNEFRDCFALSLNELGTTHITEMHIQLHDTTPVSYKPYRLPYSERVIVRDLIKELLDTKIIQESNSSYASPIVLVKKKNGEHRLCIDYRALNKKTVKDSYPMPIIDDQLDRLSGKSYFTSLDLKSGYYQIPMAEGSKNLTAFVTPDGHYEYTRMPFGLINAPAVFQHMINKALGKNRYNLALPYMDDLLSPAASIDEGLQNLRQIMVSLRDAGLTLNISKCHFFERKLDYLGYELSEEGLRPGSKKTVAVASFPTPKTVHQVRQFVGLASFFRRFIPGFASIAKPLTRLTKANIQWAWGQEEDNAFRTIKSKLVERPILALYNPMYLTEVHCDASKLGVGGILLQKPDDKSPLRPVAYYSKQTTKEEEHLHSYELETLAVVQSLKKFRTYLIGITFKVFTDCNALRTTLTKRDLVPRIARWWLLLQEYNFNIEYRPGESMRHVDALSRNPVPDSDHNEPDDMRAFEIMNVTTADWLQSVQMSDPKLKLVKTMLQTESKEIKDIINNYKIKDDKLYRKVGNSLKWVVPNSARWRVCQLNHDEAGHFATDKTLDKIKQDYWFPKMNRFVHKYVAACLNCAYNKSSTSKRSGFLHPIPKGNIPFQTLHIDHLGPFVKSKKGNSYILGIVDGFSKFIFVKAVKNLKSKTTVQILSDIFSVIGSPKVIVSDRGTSFTSAIFATYVKSIGAKHVLNAVATPRANGQIERYNRTILESIAATNHGCDERCWDEHLSKVQWSLNNTRNRATGMSPSEIVFGRRTVNPCEGPILNSIRDDVDGLELRVLGDVNVAESLSQPSSTNELPAQTSEIDPRCMEALATLQESARKLAENNIEKNQGAMKRNFDSTRAPTKFFKLGDLVMIPNYIAPANGKSKKLLPKFRGPFRISAVLKNDRYEVSSIDGHAKRRYKSVYPADALKRWITVSASDIEDSSNNSDGSNVNDDLPDV